MILNRCREGKANLERRVIEDEQWYRMRHWECMRRGAGSTVEPASGWLFNAIANKHAEAMDNFPRPNVLPREEGDKELAKVLGSILPVILQQEDFEDTPEWREKFFTCYAEMGAAYLAIAASDPETLKGVDPDRLVRSQKSGSVLRKTFDRLQMSNGFPWCIASVPIPSWAATVFPELPEDQAMEKLWDAIFETVRIKGDNTAVSAWRQHLDTLGRRKKLLNEYHFKYLHYTNSLGTDLTIQLPEDHLWAAGNSVMKNGVEFVANMPTEEIFTAPLKTGINGVVYSAMPLVDSGNIIDKFYFIIRDGKIVEAHAEKGEEFLKAAISVDEGASYFGEVALVPYDSPISNQKILFYNTLFDENASCHLAFGEAYPECIEGGESMTREEVQAHGLNYSLTHVDFMIGTADLSIVGTTHDGREIPVFINGNFAI